MNAAVIYSRYHDESGLSDMKVPFIISVIFHLTILLLLSLSLPYITEKNEIIPQAVTVEMVDIADISRSDFIAPPNQVEKDAKEEAVKPKEKTYNNDEVTPPDLAVPQPPQRNVDEQEEVPALPSLPEKREEVEDAAPKFAPKPHRKPKPPRKMLVKSEKKPKEKPKKKEAKKPVRDFSSVLKDITPDEKDDNSISELIDKTISEVPKRSQIADFSNVMTQSEIDMLNSGVSPCWVVDAGAKNARNMKVSLRVYVAPDMRVQRVEILDKERYRRDPEFRSFAESARRALRNPRCSKLRLPPEKYQQWKVFKYIFDPSGMI